MTLFLSSICYIIIIVAIITCTICGKKFWVKPSRLKRKYSVKTCSRKCYLKRRQNLPMKTMRICRWCGKKFKVNSFSNIYTCSKECSKELYKLKIRKAHWDRRFGSHNIRQQALERDKYQCFFCKTASNLHIHHIDKNRKNNILENLITLCGSCHRNVHLGNLKLP